DAFLQFILRVGIENFPGEEARRISALAGKIVVVHGAQHRKGRPFLSMGAGRPCTCASREGKLDKTIPERMLAMGFDAPGGPEVLVPCEIPVPQPGEGEVLVRVSHAGVNRPDVIQRQGHYPPPPGASPIPGLEISGTVVMAGPGVDRVLLGERVAALVTGGGYSEYCLAHHGACLPVPGDMDPGIAAAIPETLFTVWHNLFQRGLAREGEAVLVHGGTSGIG